MKKQLFLYLLLISFCISLHAQDSPDPDLRQGKLPNGFTYFIRHTDFEPGHAEFYLVQNVGALMEEDNQNGLAHFLEHMAFNGSLNFPEGIPAFLKRRGVTQPNAYTGQDETVYYINRVPTHNASLVDSCLLILHDWSGFLTLAPEAIRKERGIILEERRLRRDLGVRMEEKARPFMYNYTKYAYHDVIGNEEILNNFNRQELQEYYHDYYRPDQQAAIIVGDIDIEKVEQEILRLFSPIPKRENPKLRIVYEIPDNAEPLYTKVIDKEVPGNAVILMKRIKDNHSSDLAEMMKNNLLRLFYNNIVRRQFQTYTQETDPQFLQASINYQGLVRGYSTLHLFMRAYPGKDQEALRQLSGILNRIHRNDLNEETLREEKEKYLVDLNESEQHGNHFPNSVYIEMYQAAFLENKPITTVSEDMALSRQILSDMTVEDLHAWVKKWYDDDRNWTFIMQGNDSTYGFPTATEILSILKEAKNSIAETREESVVPQPLTDFEVEAGSIVKSRKLKKLQAEQWTLSNGLTVYYKFNPYEKERVTLFGIGNGGTSLLEAKDLPSADALNTLMLQSGIYHHDDKMMKSIMKNKKVMLQLQLGSETQTINAFGEGKDIDTLFCLVYLQLTQPRFSSDEFKKFVYVQEQDFLSSPRTVEDSLTEWMQHIRFVNSPRLWKQDTAYFRAMNFDRMVEIYKEYYGNPDSFTFYIVGDIPANKARRLVERYLASIPLTHRNLQPVHHDLRRHESIKETLTADIPGDKYMINVEFNNQLQLTPEERMTFQLIQLLLKDRYHYTIREAKGGAYSIEVNATPGEKEQFLSVRLESSLDKGDRMREEVHRQIQRIQDEEVSEEDFNDQVRNLRKSLAQRTFKPNNATIINEMIRYLKTKQFTEANTVLEKRLEKLRPVDVQRLAQKFFSTAECKDLGIKSR